MLTHLFTFYASYIFKVYHSEAWTIRLKFMTVSYFSLKLRSIWRFIQIVAELFLLESNSLTLWNIFMKFNTNTKLEGAMCRDQE